MNKDNFLQILYDQLLLEHSVGLSSTSTRKFDDIVSHFARLLNIETTDIYAVSAGSRPTNIPIRLTQGDQANRSTKLGLAFVKAPPTKNSQEIAKTAANSTRSYLINKNRGQYDNVLIIAVKNNKPTAEILLTTTTNNTSLNLQKIFPNIEIENITKTEVGNSAVNLETKIDLTDLIENFYHYCIDEAKLRLNRFNTDRLCCSLLTKPFLILTGLSGSGKTKLAQAFAQWIAAKPTDGNKSPYMALIPVGADWMGNENILGYPDGLNAENYVSKPALELILHASKPENKEKPHFLILDEMNLSHVERYFADILSGIESEEEIPLYQGGDRTAGELAIPQSLKLPKNLFIIGTVNVDETTYMFSPKVLDRANVIEFRMEIGDLTKFLNTPVKPDLDKLAGEGVEYGEDFVRAASDKVCAVPSGVKSLFDSEMERFFETLGKEGAEFGYRTAYEAGRFLHFYQKLGEHDEASDDWFDDTFDAIIIQKFLPKLHGSSSKLSSLLNNLLELCHKESDEGVKATRYKMSAAKIERMIKVLNRNGFVSFAEA